MSETKSEGGNLPVKRGRKPKLGNPERRRKFLAALKTRGSIKDACSAAGLSPSAWRRWRNGVISDPDTPKTWARFVMDVEDVLTASIHTYTDKLRDIALNDEHRRQVDALKFLLSHDPHYRRDYGHHVEHQHEHELKPAPIVEVFHAIQRRQNGENVPLPAGSDVTLRLLDEARKRSEDRKLLEGRAEVVEPVAEDEVDLSTPDKKAKALEWVRGRYEERSEGDRERK